MKSCSGTRKFYLSLLVIVLLSISFVASGCSTANSDQLEGINSLSSPPDSLVTESNDLRLEVNFLDLELRVVRLGCGLEILLIPKSDDGFLVETNGSIDAKLWP
jgi:hypothetical protein